MAIAVTFLEQEGQRPAEIAGLLAEFLAGARSTLHLAIYDFRLSDALAQPIVKALRGRVAAGVEVRIAYDAGKWATSFRQASADPAPAGTADFVKHLGDGISARPITGGDPHIPKLMHHKYIIRDGQTPAGRVDRFDQFHRRLLAVPGKQHHPHRFARPVRVLRNRL